MTRLLARIGLLALPLVGLAGVTFAADVTFVMKNAHPNAVRVELYSQDRDHIWPGGEETYYLDDGETKTMSLECEEGENICYGAWIDGDESSVLGRRARQRADMRRLLLHLRGRRHRRNQPGAVSLLRPAIALLLAGFLLSGCALLAEPVIGEDPPAQVPAGVKPLTVEQEEESTG